MAMSSNAVNHSCSCGIIQCRKSTAINIYISLNINVTYCIFSNCVCWRAVPVIGLRQITGYSCFSLSLFRSFLDREILGLFCLFPEKCQIQYLEPFFKTSGYFTSLVFSELFGLVTVLGRQLTSSHLVKQQNYYLKLRHLNADKMLALGSRIKNVNFANLLCLPSRDWCELKHS